MWHPDGVRLKFILPGQRRDDWENTHLLERFAVDILIKIRIIFVLRPRNDHKGVVMAQGVVDADAEDPFTILFLLVEVGHQVETLIAVETVVVAAFDMIDHIMVNA